MSISHAAQLPSLAMPMQYLSSFVDADPAEPAAAAAHPPLQLDAVVVDTDHVDADAVGVKESKKKRRLLLHPLRVQRLSFAA